MLSTFLTQHLIIRDSYEKREQAILHNHVEQMVINIDNRLQYFISNMELLAKDEELYKAMSKDDYTTVQTLVDRKSAEFLKKNSASVHSIRVYRSSIYSFIFGLGQTSSLFKKFMLDDNLYMRGLYISGTYLNERNEKVFSLFYRVYQNNPQRCYLLETCMYETDIFSYFSKDYAQHEVYICTNDQILSMQDRNTFSDFLYSRKSNECGYIMADLAMNKDFHDYEIKIDSQYGYNAVVRLNSSVLNQNYLSVLFRLLPLVLIVTVSAFVFSGLLTKQLNNRVRLLKQRVDNISDWNLSEPMTIDGGDEFSYLSEVLEQTRHRILLLMEENNKTQNDIRNAEMSALRAQVNSHFLFNSLSSIKWLAKEQKLATLEESIDRLALFLRHTLAIKENQVALSEELEQLEAYVYLQRLRYGDDLHIEIDVEQELLQYRTVRMVLQPLVENAIYHGRKADGSRLNITVYSSRLENEYELIVEDDGNGISPEKIEALMEMKEGISHSGYGLNNVIKRISLCSGKSPKEIISISSKIGQYTSVSIRQAYEKCASNSAGTE